MKFDFYRKLAIGLVVASSFNIAVAADYSSLSTEEMINMRNQVRQMSSEERASFRNEMRSRMKSMSTEERAQFKSMRGQGGGMGQGRNMPVFSEYDLDGDGVIVEEEFNEARGNRISARAQQGYPMRNLGKSPLFTDIDVNKDGKISPQEFALHQSQRRKMNQNQLDSSSSSTQQEAIFDPRKLVAMPEKARDIMRKDMQANLAALNAIIGYLAANDFDVAAESAEKVMGQSAMGRHRASGAAPGWFMPNEMRSLGWGMHEAASEFALVAKQGDLNNSLKHLEKLTSACVACHYTYRTR